MAMSDPDVLLADNGAKVSADLAALAARCAYQVAASENYLNEGESVAFTNDPHVATPAVQFNGISASEYPVVSGNYSNLIARLNSVTDIEYLQQELPVPSSGAVTFTSSFVAGAKVVRLVDTSTGRTKCYIAENIGRLRSYDFPIGDAAYEQFRNRGYTYDQAIYIYALIAAQADVTLLDRAAVGLVQCQIADGSFPFSVNILSAQGDAYVRNGAVAWCLYALAQYVSYRGGEADASVLPAVVQCADFLLTQISSAGLQAGSITGGYGRYNQDNTFDVSYVVPWASTEHNVDAFFALSWAARVTGDSRYMTAVANIATNLLTHHWNAAGRYFYQGVSDPATVDTASALDCMTWGAYFLYAVGRLSEATASVDRAIALYQNTVDDVTGFAPYIPGDGYASATPTVWTEGTLGAAAAFYRLGMFDAFKACVDAIDALRDVDGLLPYANAAVPAYEIVTYPAAIGVAWDAIVRSSPAVIFSAPGATRLVSRHVGVSADAYARQLKQLLPRGILWRLEPDSWLSRLLLGIADELARIDGRGEDLLDEWDPSAALETLSDWERVVGIPDGCAGISTLLTERQAAVVAKLIARGGATPAYFVEMAARLGFVATLDEPAAHTWRMTVDLAASAGIYTLRVWLFRAGVGRAGDRVATTDVPQLECVLRRAAPAHATAWFRYYS